MFNTGNPVLPDGSQDPRDLIDNAKVFDRLLNDQSIDTANDRLGQPRASWHSWERFLENAGYESPVAYAGGINITRYSQTVEYNGDIYAAFKAEIPFTTSGTFESAKFFLVQGVTEQELSLSSGAGMVGWSRSPISLAVSNVAMALDAAHVSVWEFANLAVGYPSGSPSSWDWTPAFNAAITYLATIGGGYLNAAPGTYTILGTIYLVSRVKLNLLAVSLVGNGTNTIFETGWLNGSVTESNVDEYGTGHTGIGTHYVEHCVVFGAKITNCLNGARLHRFNYGCVIESCDIDAEDFSIFATHSWSQQYRNNLFRQTVRLQDFVDWTIVEGNSFEHVADGAGLEIGQDQSGGETTYGGSWTLTIRNNGFHGCLTSILGRVEVENCLIESNHFENGQVLTAPSIRHIHFPSSLTCKRFVVKNNHITATRPNVTAIEFAALRDSEFVKNDYVTSGAGAFVKHIVLNTSNTFGNEIEVPYSPTGAAPDLSLYTLADTNRIFFAAGSNNSAITQPVAEIWSGTGVYTAEKYRAKYRYSGGNIPFCSGVLVANEYTLDTFVDTDAQGTFQPVLCNLRFHGAANTMEFIGHVAGLTIAPIVLRTRLGAAAAPTVVASNNAGKLRLVFSGVPSDTVIRGWVKEM